MTWCRLILFCDWTVAFSNIVDLVKLWTCGAPDQGLFLFLFFHFTLSELSERKLLLLLWFISRFCLFIRSQCSFVLSMICCFSPLQRPYYEIRLRVGGTTRFTSRIICCIILLQRKSADHSSLPPLFNVFHAVVPGPLLFANLPPGISL